MKTTSSFGIILALALSANACDSGSSDDEGEVAPPTPSEDVVPPAGNETEPEEAGFHLSERTQTNEPIRLNERRSNINPIETTAACKPGEVPVFDSCFERIEIDENFTINLIDNNGSKRLEEMPELLATFEERDDDVYRNIFNKDCTRCYRTDILDSKMTIEDDVITEIELDLRYRHGQIDFPDNPRGFASAHDWVVNGSINVDGITLQLPFKARDVLDKLPDATYDEDDREIYYEIPSKNQSIRFSFNKFKITPRIQEIAGEGNYIIDKVKIYREK